MLIGEGISCRFSCSMLVNYMLSVADRLPQLEKRELLFLLSFTGKHVVSVKKGFFFLLVLGIGCVILLWDTLCLSCYYF